MTDLLMRRSAVLSCGPATYRYRLEREFGTPGRTAAVIMVNPSIADHEVDDHTIRKLIGFSQRLGVGRLIVGNKFAFRATDVSALRLADDPVGPDNDRHLEQIMRDADLHIVAWGPLGKLPKPLRSRWRDVARLAEMVGCRLMCFGTALDGHPLHPLTLGYDRQLTAWHNIAGEVGR